MTVRERATQQSLEELIGTIGGTETARREQGSLPNEKDYLRKTEPSL